MNNPGARTGNYFTKPIGRLSTSGYAVTRSEGRVASGQRWPHSMLSLFLNKGSARHWHSSILTKTCMRTSLLFHLICITLAWICLVQPHARHCLEPRSRKISLDAKTRPKRPRVVCILSGINFLCRSCFHSRKG